MGMAQGRRNQTINKYHLAHVIEDVFNPPNAVVVYEQGDELISTLRSPEFSIEAWELASTWAIGINDTNYGFNFCKLLLTIDYSPKLTRDSADAALAVYQLMQRDGLVCILHNAKWSYGWMKKLNLYLRERPDLEKEIRRYKMFQDWAVKVYQK